MKPADAERLLDLYDLAHMKRQGVKLTPQAVLRVTGKKNKDKDNTCRQGYRLAKWAKANYGVDIKVSLDEWDIDDEAVKAIPADTFDDAAVSFFKGRFSRHKKKKK